KAGPASSRSARRVPPYRPTPDPPRQPTRASFRGSRRTFRDLLLNWFLVVRVVGLRRIRVGVGGFLVVLLRRLGQRRRLRRRIVGTDAHDGAQRGNHVLA